MNEQNDWDNFNPDDFLDFDDFNNFKASTEEELAIFNSPITDHEDKESYNNSSKDHSDIDEDNIEGMNIFMKDPFVQAHFLSCDAHEMGLNIKRKYQDLTIEEGEQEKYQVKKTIQKIKKVVMKTFVPNDENNFLKNSKASVNLCGQEKVRKDILKSFFNTFNSAGNMFNLGQLVGQIAENCTLVTNDLPEPLNGRCCIMALFAILLEYYPDGIYELLKMTSKANTFTGIYSFSGTAVFKISIETLVDSVKLYMRQQVSPCNIETIQDGLEFLWSPDISTNPTTQNPTKSSKGHNKCKKQIAFTYDEHNSITFIVISNII